MTDRDYLELHLPPSDKEQPGHLVFRGRHGLVLTGDEEGFGVLAADDEGVWLSPRGLSLGAACAYIVSTAETWAGEITSDHYAELAEAEQRDAELDRDEA